MIEKKAETLLNKQQKKRVKQKEEKYIDVDNIYYY